MIPWNTPPELPKAPGLVRFCPTEDCTVRLRSRFFQRPPQQMLSTTVLAHAGKGHSQHAWLRLPGILLSPQRGSWCPIERIRLEIQVGVIFGNKDIPSQLAEACSEKEDRARAHLFPKFQREQCKAEAELLTHRLQCSLLQGPTLPSTSLSSRSGAERSRTQASLSRPVPSRAIPHARPEPLPALVFLKPCRSDVHNSC